MTASPGPLSQVRVLSLALNLPGPAALMRCRRMGATCAKIEPPGGDPMRHYSPAAYEELHEGVAVMEADLKTGHGQAVVHRELALADVLITSFRPSALKKLGLDWPQLQARYPALCQVAIVGGTGAAAEVPGHDLTYLAENGLVSGTDLPATLFADMAGSLLASEAVLQSALLQAGGRLESGDVRPGGRYFEVALAESAGWLAMPRRWGLTQPTGFVGGAHGGYRVYPCADGRVAAAAIEPHFAAALCALAGLPPAEQPVAMFAPATHSAIARFLASKTRHELDRLAVQHDLPLHTLAPE